jgi:glycosyltransferase involved in cell wall biosynthesis
MVERMKNDYPFFHRYLGSKENHGKTVIMLRNNDTPDYDMRMALQKKTLEEAGYNVYQIFIRIEKGLDIWCLHGDDCTYWTEEQKIPDLLSRTIYYSAMHKPLAPFRNYLSSRMLYKAIKCLVKEKIDVVHAHNLDMMPLAITLKKEYGCKIIYDMREMYAFMAGRGFSSTVEGYYLYKDKQMWKEADYVFTMEDVTYEWMSFLQSVLSKNKHVPIVTVANSRPLKYQRYREPTNLALELLFLGTISEPRFLQAAIEVVEEFRGQVKFILGGNVQTDNYYKKTIEMGKSNKYKHTSYIGQLPHSEVVPMTRKCDAVFCMIDPKQRNNARAMANKQHEAMVAGRPIIVTQGTHSGDITAKYNCGLVIPHTKQGLRDALNDLIHTPRLSVQLGKNGLNAAKTLFNWKLDSDRMLAAYEELLK